jgi:hypothetical protein
MKAEGRLYSQQQAEPATERRTWFNRAGFYYQKDIFFCIFQ